MSSFAEFRLDYFYLTLYAYVFHNTFWFEYQDNQMDGDLMGLALRSTKDDMLDVAQWVIL